MLDEVLGATRNHMEEMDTNGSLSGQQLHFSTLTYGNKNYVMRMENFSKGKES